MLNQFINRLLRLAATDTFWYETRVRGHRHRVEISAETIRYYEGDVQEEVRRNSPWENVEDIAYSDPEQSAGENTGQKWCVVHTLHICGRPAEQLLHEVLKTVADD